MVVCVHARPRLKFWMRRWLGGWGGVREVEVRKVYSGKLFLFCCSKEGMNTWLTTSQAG